MWLRKKRETDNLECFALQFCHRIQNSKENILKIFWAIGALLFLNAVGF